MQVQDSIPFSIGIASDEGPISTASNPNGILFPKGQPSPSAKVLTFQRSSSFRLEVFYANPDELPAGVSSKISCFTVSLVVYLCIYIYRERERHVQTFLVSMFYS